MAGQQSKGGQSSARSGQQSKGGQSSARTGQQSKGGQSSARTGQQSKGGQSSARSGQGKVSPAEVEKYIGGVNFPCQKDGLIQQAQSNHAPQEVMDALNRTPDREYSSAADLAKGLGQAV